MKLRHLVISLGAVTALCAASAFAQTTIYVDPAANRDPNAAVVIVAPRDTYVVTPDTAPAGTQYMVDSYGRPIVVDQSYGSPPERRSIFDSSVDHTTGTITSPGYMGPRDSRGQ